MPLFSRKQHHDMDPVTGHIQLHDYMSTTPDVKTRLGCDPAKLVYVTLPGYGFIRQVYSIRDPETLAELLRIEEIRPGDYRIAE